MKTEIMRIIQESPNHKFKSKEIASILKISVTDSSKYLFQLCNIFRISSGQENGVKVFYMPVVENKSGATQSRIAPEFKPMVGYSARMSERLDRKDFHLITLDEH